MRQRGAPFVALDAVVAACLCAGCVRMHAPAARLRDGPIVCVTAEIDRIVPAESQEALWRALGEPPRYRFDGGHLELFLFARWNILPVVREVATKAGKGAARQPTGTDGLLALDALPSRP